MNMAINVYAYGRGGKCVYMFSYTYAGIREMKSHFVLVLTLFILKAPN